jgi:PAS domain S-box-containing protein
MVDGITGQLGLIRMLRGLTPEFGSFNDEQFDEVRFERHLESDPHLANPACRYWIRKLQARFYGADDASAVEAAAKAQQLLWAMPPSIEIPDYHFHTALVRARCYALASAGERHQHLEALAAHYQQLMVWAENCPENFGNRAALVGAEIASIEGRQLDAERLYEEAIRSARENGFIQNEAIANEIAGRFYYNRGFETIGQTYLRNARSGYLQWGAEAKVKQLDRLYPGLEEPAPLGPTIETGPPFEQLDLMTVVKALQAVSREIDLGKLIETLMVISVEHAGAERGLLFLSRGQEHRIEAEATTYGDHIQVVLRQGFATLPGFPESVLRAHESVILDNASAKSAFSDDEYIRAKGVRSILCLPLVKHGELIGALYLENSLTSCVFTPDRLTVLELLASQATISLENARLYAELQHENSDRRKAEEALRASEERMSLAAESANLGMWVWDIPGDDIWATEKCRLLLGFEPTERLDFRKFIDRLHPEDRAPTREALRRSLQTRSEYDMEYRVVLPDGSVRWISVRGHATFDAENRAVRLMGVSIDITSTKLAQLQLLQQRDELAHLSRVTTLGEMATTLAHELNQPLAAIHSNAETAEILLAKEPLELDELRSIVNDIRQDGLRAAEVILRMRSLLRRHQFKMERIEVKSLIEAVSELLHGVVISHRARLRIELAPALPPVLGDAIHLQQILLNLIINALEAMVDCPTRERQVVVRAATHAALGLEVTVTDQGPGFSKGKLAKLFEPFFTTKKKGMGMGLAICQRIIQSHGGHLSAENNPDRGATVRFTLPIGPNKLEGSAWSTKP